MLENSTQEFVSGNLTIVIPVNPDTVSVGTSGGLCPYSIMLVGAGMGRWFWGTGSISSSSSCEFSLALELKLCLK